VPVGRLFMGAVAPGVILIVMFIVYILIYAKLNPQHAPTIKLVTKDGSAQGTLGSRVVKSLIPPLALVLAVLGSIFFGIASPTESAAFGAFGALLLAYMHKRLDLSNLKQAMLSTTQMTSMVFMILVGATAFGLVFRGMGGDELVTDVMTNLPGGEWGFLIVSMLVIFVLGFFLDFIEICFIVVPIIAPIAQLLGLDLLWFTVLIALNLQTSFLTPPFGFSLFYLKAAAPPEVNMSQIYRGIIPFVVIQLMALALIMAFPNTTLWLPNFMDSLR
jgi:tripartite ATP-independent transporter DctM subunit